VEFHLEGCVIEWPRPTSSSFQRLDETNVVLAERSRTHRHGRGCISETSTFGETTFVTSHLPLRAAVWRAESSSSWRSPIEASKLPERQNRWQLNLQQTLAIDVPQSAGDALIEDLESNFCVPEEAARRALEGSGSFNELLEGGVLKVDLSV
jgi:hypothetical protein